MKVFIALSALLALAVADQSSHQTIKHGHSAPVHTSIHKPHGAYHSSVVSQPHAAPQDVHNPYAPHKPAAKVHAPAHIPVHAAPYHPAPAPYHPAPYHPAPAPYHPAPYHPAPAPYHPAPVVHRPAPYHPAPIVHKPAPYHPAPVVHKPAPYHPAPVVHKPAPYHPAPVHQSPYHAESYDTPAVYQYGYAVNDDYAGTNFAQNESRDGYATNGEYRVALPDGRTQIVTYSVGDAYSGYVADVKYEGEAHYEPYHPAPKPSYAPVHGHA